VGDADVVHGGRRPGPGLVAGADDDVLDHELVGHCPEVRFDEGLGLLCHARML